MSREGGLLFRYHSHCSAIVGGASYRVEDSTRGQARSRRGLASIQSVNAPLPARPDQSNSSSSVMNGGKEPRDQSFNQNNAIRMQSVKEAVDSESRSTQTRHVPDTEMAVDFVTGSSDTGEGEKAVPQHESLSYYDLVIEAERISIRNKRLLLSRLDEASRGGRLSLINLIRRDLDANDARLLQQAIIANPFLSVLKLSYNRLGDAGAAIVAEALQHYGRSHENLSVLDLGFNSIGDAGCEALAVKCVAGNYTLQTLFLSGNTIREKGALALAGAILHGTGLSRLHLTANDIGSTGMKAIGGAIAQNDARSEAANTSHETEPALRSMEELHVNNVAMDSTGFITIPGFLLTNKALKTLCICGNKIDDNDMMVLSQALNQNKCVPLETLHLSFNDITCQGVEFLMNSIWGSQTLREVKLDNNRVQDRGAQLCAVVLTSVQLEVLDLSFNRVTTLGLKALMKNLSENSSLKSLALSGIPIDQNASKAVSYALAYNTSLQALYLDNCSTGYSSQRHIVAGVVSNRKASLRILTGFALGPIAMTLGLPKLPEEWSNDQVLGFVRLMWQQWQLKSGRGHSNPNDSSVYGPAPPAAVAAAAKIAFSSLGTSPERLLQTELHKRPLAERAPVDSAAVALLERTDSGTLRLPEFSDQSETEDLRELETKPSGKGGNSLAALVSQYRGPFEDPERRNRNLEWLRLHFRSLNDIGRLPFNNADLWQLHQYYFSPPVSLVEGGKSSDESSDSAEMQPERRTAPAPPPTPVLSSSRESSLERVVSFQALGEAFASSGVAAPGSSHKRPSSEDIEEGTGHLSKRPKNLKPRIGYYPRIMAKAQSLGTRPMDQTLSLLRQLKYTESVLFAGRDPFSDFTEQDASKPTHSDVEMILLDLL